MARNLCTSMCPKCEYTLRLSDIRGKPVEFRRYGVYAPVIGVRFDCQCGEVYFVSWKEQHSFWSKEALDNGSWKEPEFEFREQRFKNLEQGKFVFEEPDFRNPSKMVARNTGVFTLDLSHYETFNDEPMEDGFEKTAIQQGKQKPWHLCTDDAEDTQWVWKK
jgi:hypothetical protein